MLLFRQPCVQFSLQATRPLKDYPRNTGGLSGRGIQLFADHGCENGKVYIDCRKLRIGKEERRRILEGDRRKEEEEKEKGCRREGEEGEARRQERELRKLELEAGLLKQKEAIETAKRKHEVELTRLGRGVAKHAEVREDRAKAPKLPSFVDGKDDLDAYLQRFERFAATAKWEKTGWASKLSALLSGRALEAYSRLSEDAAQDYD